MLTGPCFRGFEQIVGHRRAVLGGLGAAGAMALAPRAFAAESAGLDARIRDIVPQGVELSAEENPFPTAYAQRSSQMFFNVPAYARLLLTEFFSRGGRFVMRNFQSPADLAALPKKVVIHATGFAARDLWRDDTVIPVRGQPPHDRPRRAAALGSGRR